MIIMSWQMAEYYKWYQEDRLSGGRTFLFGIKAPRKRLMDPWAYFNLRTKNDKLEDLWINISYVKPEELTACPESKSDKEYVSRYLKGNKGKIIVNYFNVFGHK